MSGVAPLLAKTGISKRTLYKYFRSKEDLIVEVLEYYQHKSFEEIPLELERRANSPKNKILALFDFKAEAIDRGDFRGCLALKAKLEFEGLHPAIEKVCKKFNEDLQNFIFELCVKARCKTPKQVSRQIAILFEGAIALGQIYNDSSVYKTARDTAEHLLTLNIK
jgi:AcrR family transcriptional regulator